MGNKKRETVEESMLYRQAMQVKEILVCKGNIYEFNAYNIFPICPNCDIPMERDYQKYCGHCGQKLSWKGYGKANLRYAGRNN